MTIEKRKKDPNDDEKVKFCFRGNMVICQNTNDEVRDFEIYLF